MSTKSLHETRLSEAPKVRQFLDARAYLQAVYDWRKSSSPRFSYSLWASEFGFRSRSFLRYLLIGKRSITENSIPILVKGLGLSKSEGEYFEILVRFNQAKTLEQRERLGRELARRSRASEELIDIQNRLRFISDPLLPRLQTLLSLEDVVCTPAPLAVLLGAPLSRIQESLEILESLGLASRKTHGSTQTEIWVATVQAFEVKEELGNLGLKKFYQKSFEECAAAIELPKETRNFQSAFFPLSSDEYQSFNQELAEFLKQALSRYGSNSGQARRIYQITTGMIPVSLPVLQVEKSRPAPEGSHHRPELSGNISQESL